MSREKVLPWMKWFVRDYLAATRVMSLAERGAYTDLLFIEWDSGPLPAEPERLARLLGCTPAELEAVWPAIRGKFTDCLDGTGRLVNRRLETVRREGEKAAELSGERASRAARARWNKGADVIEFEGARAHEH